MSCKMNGSRNSEVDAEPVSRLLNVGQPTPLKTSARRHIINPNFMFFCQIVLLIIPITVLYAGLYFMNISSNIIILICGAIVLTILCIFVFVRPFKEEKCAEKKPLRQSYEYTPFKKIDDPAAIGSTRPKKTKRHVNEADTREEKDDDESTSHAKNVSKDTLLSIATSDFSRIATQPRICTEANPIQGMNASAGTTGRFGREENVENAQITNKQKWTTEDSDGGTCDTKGLSMGVDNTTLTRSLVVIEEEGETSRCASQAPSPSSEHVQHTKKLLWADLALSDTTRSSTNQTLNELRDTTCSDKTRTQHLSQPSGRRTPGYNTQNSSAYPSINGKPSLCDSLKRTSPPRSQVNYSQTCDSDQSNIENGRNFSHCSTHLTCSNTIPLSVSIDQDSHAAYSAGLPPTSNVCQKFGQQFTERRSLHSYGDYDQSASKRQQGACANKLCPFTQSNQIASDFVPKSSMDHNKHVSNCQGNTKILPEKPAKPMQNSRRGYMNGSGDEVNRSPQERRDLLPTSPKEQSNNSPKESTFQTTKFQLCPGDGTPKNDQISSTKDRTKQPILIKLFPTSSKDGMFSWESNSATKSKTVDSYRTKDECVQTTEPEMVETQTSAVFPGAQNQEQSKFQDLTPAQNNDKTKPQKGAHQAKSGSMVDFVLRPFSKLKPIIRPPRDAKARVKCSRKVNQDSKNYERKGQSNQDSSQFDLLRVQPWQRNINHRTLSSGRGGSTKPESPNKGGPFLQKERTDKLDICSIYYSSISGKLYQPTRSGLLVTDSSKETVEDPQQYVESAKLSIKEPHKTSNFGEQTKFNHSQNNKRVSTKRKSDENIISKPECAKHARSDARKPNPIRGTEKKLPWTETPEIYQRSQKYESDLNKITFMYPPFNLDFSSGPCDEISKGSSDQTRNKETKINKTVTTHKAVPKKPQSPEVQRQSKHKNRRISHQIETTLFKKSSSSYENVVIEKVIKQKKRTMKKFK